MTVQMVRKRKNKVKSIFTNLTYDLHYIGEVFNEYTILVVI